MGTRYVTALLTLLFYFSALFKKSFLLEYTFNPSCSGQSCSLLSTFRSALLTSRNLTLVLSPGTHRMPLSTMTLQGHQFLEIKPSNPNKNTVILCQPTSQQLRYDMVLQHPAHVKISGLIFSGCYIQFNGVHETNIQNTEFVNQTIRFSSSHNITINKSVFRMNNNSFSNVITFYGANNVVIQDTEFVNQRKGVIYFHGGNNITIDKSVFRNSIGFSSYTRHIYFGLSRNVAITGTSFVNNRMLSSYSTLIGVYHGLNITIDNITVSNNNLISSRSATLEIHSTNTIKVTRTNFINNTVSSYSGVIQLSNCIVFIGCSNFYNNSATGYSGIIQYEGSRSFLYITNGIFGNNAATSPGGIIYLYQGDEVLIINSTFTNNNLRSRYYGVITMGNGQKSATILKSKFIGRSYPVLPSSGRDVIMDCSAFVNSTNIPTRYIQNYIGYCAKYGTQYSAICPNAECDLTECQPPTTEISLEQSEYTVDEGIGKSNMGLQVCVVATDLLFGVKLTLQVINGSAMENVDFYIDSHQCREFQLIRKPGAQKHCEHVRILEDSVKEGTEQFSLSLSTVNPYVTFNIKKATVFITEGVEATSRPRYIPTSTPSYMSTTSLPAEESTTAQADKRVTPIPVSRPSTLGTPKTAIVECGPLRRHVNFTSECTDHNNLVAAIVKTFGDLTGLQANDIAVLQTKSNQQKYYFDVLSPITAIANYSMVKVVPYDGFSCTPKST